MENCTNTMSEWQRVVAIQKARAFEKGATTDAAASWTAAALCRFFPLRSRAQRVASGQSRERQVKRTAGLRLPQTTAHIRQRQRGRAFCSFSPGRHSARDNFQRLRMVAEPSVFDGCQILAMEDRAEAFDTVAADYAHAAGTGIGNWQCDRRTCSLVVGGGASHPGLAFSPRPLVPAHDVLCDSLWAWAARVRAMIWHRSGCMQIWLKPKETAEGHSQG